MKVWYKCRCTVQGMLQDISLLRNRACAHCYWALDIGHPEWAEEKYYRYKPWVLFVDCVILKMVNIMMIVMMMMIVSYTNDDDHRIVHESSSWWWLSWMTMITFYKDDDGDHNHHNDDDCIVQKLWWLYRTHIDYIRCGKFPDGRTRRLYE